MNKSRDPRDLSRESRDSRDRSRESRDLFITCSEPVHNLYREQGYEHARDRALWVGRCVTLRLVRGRAFLAGFKKVFFAALGLNSGVVVAAD